MRTRYCFLFLLLFALQACTSAASDTPVSPPTFTPEVDKPPALTLQINGSVHTAYLGSYCWNYQSELNESVGACLDSAAISTSSTPIVVKSPIVGELIFASDRPPVDVVGLVFPATPENEFADVGDELRLWNYSEGTIMYFQSQVRQQVTLELEPGLYVFHVTCDWQERGNAGYGFLIEVSK